MVQVDHIPYRDTGYFSKLICDYLDKNEELAQFYNRFPAIENFEAQLQEKGAHFSSLSRKRLHTQLNIQYKDVTQSNQTALNIDLLLDEKTFTITTGHQLNLFTGPLYFLYKIISVINLTKQLKTQYPTYNFVPVYWMATEDHDFDEINYFKFKGQKIHWNRPDGGAVGDLDTKGLDEVYKIFSAQLGGSVNALQIKKLFEKAYVAHGTLTAATRYLANAFFAKHGLVIIDGHDAGLKALYAPYIKRELEEEITFDTVTAKTKQLEALGYHGQVFPRSINLFYLFEGGRERILKQGNDYVVNNTNFRFTHAAILEELSRYPERFSPNALLRPIYQEVILPNLCYIGGGGELAYWFQLSDTFKTMNVPFPILLLRNSVLLRTSKQAFKASRLAIDLKGWFSSQNDLINKHVRKISDIEIDFSSQRDHLKTQFKALEKIASSTDKSFIGAVAAQQKKQIKGLDALEKRLLKAQKKKLSEEVQRVVDLQNEMFPEQSLQERNTNVSQFYLQYGEGLIEVLNETLDPLKQEFTVLTLD